MTSALNEAISEAIALEQCAAGGLTSAQFLQGAAIWYHRASDICTSLVAGDTLEPNERAWLQLRGKYLMGKSRSCRAFYHYERREPTDAETELQAAIRVLDDGPTDSRTGSVGDAHAPVAQLRACAMFERAQLETLGHAIRAREALDAKEYALARGHYRTCVAAQRNAIALGQSSGLADETIAKARANECGALANLAQATLGALGLTGEPLAEDRRYTFGFIDLIELLHLTSEAFEHAWAAGTHHQRSTQYVQLGLLCRDRLKWILAHTPPLWDCIRHFMPEHPIVGILMDELRGTQSAVAPSISLSDNERRSTEQERAYDVVAERSGASCAVQDLRGQLQSMVDDIESCGMTVPPASRVRQYLAILRNVSEGVGRERGDKTLGEDRSVSQAVMDTNQLLALAQWRPWARREWKPVVHRMLADSVVPAEVTVTSKGRDAQLELRIGALIAAAGLDPVSAEPDVCFTWNAERVGVAAKRIKGLRGARDRIKSACEQIAEARERGSIARGIIAMDCSYWKQQHIYEVEANQDAEMLLSGETGLFTMQSSRDLRKYAERHAVGGLLVSVSILVHVRESGRSLAVERFAMVCLDPKEDDFLRALTRQLATSMSESKWGV